GEEPVALYTAESLGKSWLLLSGDAVQHDADDGLARLLGRPVVPAAKVDVGPGDGVEGDVRGRDLVAGQSERPVGDAVTQEDDERVQIVGRLAGRGVLVERLVGRQHQWQMAIEDVAERLEGLHQPLATGAAR